MTQGSRLPRGFRSCARVAALLALPAIAQAAPIGSTPANGAGDVSRVVAPGFRFGESGEAAAVTADHLRLLAPVGVPVPGIVRTSGDSAVVVPATPLAGCTTYTLELDGAGGGPVQSHFTTVCPRWQPAVQIDDARTARRVDRPVSGVEVAAGDGAGFVAVWFQDEGTRRAILANSFNPATEFWSAPQDIDRRAPDAGASNIPVIVSDASGQVTAVWFQAIGGRNAILASRLLGDEWGAPRRLDDPHVPGDATDPQLATDALGNVTVAWQQPDGRHTAIYAARWERAALRWLPARRLDRLDANAYNPAVAATPNGRVVVAWEQGGRGSEAVYASAFRPGSEAWSPPDRLSATSLPAGQPALAASPRGDFTAAWVVGDGASRRIAVARAAAGTASWSRPIVMRAAGFAGAALAPALAVDAGGNVTLAWEQADRSDPRNARYAILASRLAPPSRDWTTPHRIDDPLAASAGNPVLVADGAGNVYCAWYQDGSQGMQVYAARYDPGKAGWAAAVRLSDPLLTVQATLPALAVNAAGSVVAVWQQYNGWRTIAAASWLP